MKIQDIENRGIKVSKSTITLLNEGKTAGMLTQVETYYNVRLSEKFDIGSALRKAGVWGQLDLKRLFRLDKIWYYLVDDKQVYWAKEFEAIDGKAPQERLAKSEAAAVIFGATVIHVKSIHDTRDLI